MSSQSRHSVRTLRTKALGIGVCLRRTDRCLDDPDSFAAEDLLERGGELAVAVVDQESHPFERSAEAEVARLLGHPAAGRVGRAARQVDAAAFELDEEEEVEAAERDRLDGEEIAGERARGFVGGGSLARSDPHAATAGSRPAASNN